ncbi:hypothetical protein TIFTF001_001626 [Ficus carica]|uniref:Disease resistance protein At4g27190-like leucine-rich repeats domain-containing protein n=1 Tax=Ficus carica TaxID=3494 RepID=A0AA87ZHB5_FICCA|nr:hypothetical protein TIFTF001_001626 [Ficus carica]
MSCNNVKYLLSFTLRLEQLKEQNVSYSEDMEQIVTKAVVEDHGRLKNLISFPKLEYLELRSLPKLKRFCEGDCLKYPSLLNLQIWRGSKFGTFIPNSQSTEPMLQAVDEERPLFNEKVVFIKLQELTIYGCNSLFSVWALATFECLQQLKKLRIEWCDLIEEVLIVIEEAGDAEERESKKISFPKLESLELRDLPNLKRTFIAKSTPSTSTTVEEVEERRMAQEILFNSKGSTGGISGADGGDELLGWSSID